MTAFMYLLLAPKALLGRPRTPDQARENGERWHRFGESLRAAGRLVTAGHLDAAGNRLSGRDAQLSAGAFGDELVVGGYFIVEAASLEEATELAKECPLLTAGGTVEVRPLMPE